MVHSVFFAFYKMLPISPFSPHSNALEGLKLASNCLLFRVSIFAEVSEMSSRLTSDTRIYADKAKDRS